MYCGEVEGHICDTCLSERTECQLDCDDSDSVGVDCDHSNDVEVSDREDDSDLPPLVCCCKGLSGVLCNGCIRDCIGVGCVPPWYMFETPQAVPIVRYPVVPPVLAYKSSRSPYGNRLWVADTPDNIKAKRLLNMG